MSDSPRASDIPRTSDTSRSNVLPPVDIDVVVATHDLRRPVARAVASALRGADLRGVLPSGHRVRVTVACHELPADQVRAAVQAGLDDLAAADPTLEEVSSHVRYLEVFDGMRSPAGPFNAGIAAADGRYLSIIGSDDSFAEGALEAWATWADERDPAWLMARLETDQGVHVPTPRTRPGRTRDLDLVSDRLAYRTAPLGLLRRQTLVDLGLLPEPLTPGLASGEDVELSLRLASSGERIDYAQDLPPYVIGTDGERTTFHRRPLTDELAAYDRLLDQRWLLALPSAARRAIVVKILRIHVLAAVGRRPGPLDWAPGEARWVQRLTRELLAMAPDAEKALHRADLDLLHAILSATDTDALAAAARRRGQASRWDILLSPDPLANLDRESTVRAHLATHARELSTRLSTQGRGFADRTTGRGPELHSTDRPRVLVLSFSPIASDARVLKQVRHLSAEFDVVTCGYGPAPEGVVSHLRIPDEAGNSLDGRLITLRSYRAAYLAQAGVRWVLRHLHPGQADVILANDLDTVPLALWLRPRAGVHADLHEYWPRLHEENDAWMRRISPYHSWLCRRFLPGCAAVTTVSDRIAQEYSEQFGVEVGVVTNAAPFADQRPGPVSSPLRLVHSGACLRNRGLHVMVEAVLAVAAGTPAAPPVTLDLYLTPNDPAYLAELRELAGADGSVVRVHDPVPYSDLIATLNGYDVGVFVLAPVNFNYEMALPNKIFDYVQARLALLVGPSPEMARVTLEHGLGVVSDGFDRDSLTTAILALDPGEVAAHKAASHAAARTLSDDEQSRRWVESVRDIAAGVAPL
ncbi:glycosyltransferase [Ornithinimicrobium panacihumi]|uniref:glycosyltransferase n=1 Tax=Ornithinimicrobium panacihumi TaxID=2008449 RepID=UPI003F88BED5